jgi:hypothetical protein
MSLWARSGQEDLERDRDARANEGKHAERESDIAQPSSFQGAGVQGFISAAAIMPPAARHSGSPRPPSSGDDAVKLRHHLGCRAAQPDWVLTLALLWQNSLGWQPGPERTSSATAGVEQRSDGGPYRGQARLRRWADVSFFPFRRFEAPVLEVEESDHGHEGVPV